MSLTSTNYGKVYTFETYDGARYKNYKFVTTLDPATVMALGFDAPAKHHQMMPHLPDGTPTGYQNYLYAKFVDANGGILYLGIPWVKTSTLVENGAPSYQIVLKNPDPESVESVRSMLVASGIEDFSITPI